MRMEAICREGTCWLWLRRSLLGYLGAWLLVRVVTRNRLTRYDAPLSVHRAYTCAEALALARAAWRLFTRIWR